MSFALDIEARAYDGEQVEATVRDAAGVGVGA